MPKKTKSQIKWENERAAIKDYDHAQEIGARDFGWLWVFANKLAIERATAGFDHAGYLTYGDLENPIMRAAMVVSILSALQEAKTFYDRRSLRLFGMTISISKEQKQ